MGASRSHPRGEARRRIHTGRRERPVADVLLVLVLSAAAPGLGSAGPPGRQLSSLDTVAEERIGAISMASTLTLSPITPDEILGDASFVALSDGSWSPGAIAGGSVNFGTRIVRTLPAVWSLRVRDEAAIHDLSIRYELSDASGPTDRLRHASDGDSEIAVLLRPLEPVVVFRDVDSVVVEGGIELVLDLGDVRTAGTYSGTLTVTVDSF